MSDYLAQALGIGFMVALLLELAAQCRACGACEKKPVARPQAQRVTFKRIAALSAQRAGRLKH